MIETTKKQKNRYEVSLYEDDLIETTHLSKKLGKEKEKSPFIYLGYIGQVGFVIAFPIAGGAILGSYLDTKWGTYPKTTILGLLIGIVISVINFIAVIKEIIRGSNKQ